jgi:hypothetical protein
MLTDEHIPTTPLPTIEPLPYSLESKLTGVPMPASMTPNDEQESSSVEAGWGRIESSKERERMEGLRLWESINVEVTQTKGQRKLTDTDDATCVAKPSPQLTWIQSWNSSVKSVTKN